MYRFVSIKLLIMISIHFKKYLIGLLLLVYSYAYGQSISNYSFSASTGSYSALTGATFPTLSAADDGFVNNIPIGFDFWYMGSKYTTIGISSNGFISFNTITNATVNNSLSANGQRPIIAPLWDDLSAVTTNSNISYKLSGVAPNRTFTVEFNNMRWNYNAAGAVIDFQVTLYETSGVVQFDYFQEATSYSSGTSGASIGITATATGTNNYMSLSGSGASPTASVSSETSGIASKPANNQRYSFTPSAVSTPTSFTATAASSSQINLAWTDNSAAEVGYVLYYSTNSTVPLDETSSTVITLAANSTSYNLTGLNCGTTYYFKIFAYREGLTTNVTANTSTSSGSSPNTQANNINFTSVAASNMTINWTRGNGTACAVYVNTTNSFSAPANGSTPIVSSNYTSGQQCVYDGTASSVSITGLAINTTYFVRIYESNCTGSNRTYNTVTATNNPNNQTTTSGTTFTVGLTGTYTTIQAAYNACTGSDTYFVDIQSDYNQASETFPISLGALANKSASNTVTIRPQSGVTNLTISQSTATSIFYFSAGDFVTIDGRAGSIGSSVWTLTNSGTTSNRRVFYFDGGSTYNTIQYLTILGSNSSSSGANNTGGGIIYFFTGQNNFNTISNCNIGSSGGNRPAWMIDVYTAAGSANANITISNNNFYDFSEKAIFIETNSAANNWSILNNSFYQSGAFTLTADLFGIDIDSGSGYIITGNYFGGRSSNCGGSAFTLNSSAFEFYVISFNTSSGSTNTISNNTVQNISITSTSSSTVFEVLDISGTASFTVGSSGNGNIIGSTSGTESITITDNGTSSNGFTIFDFTNTGTNNITYNSFGGISLSGSNIASTTSIVKINGSSTSTVNYNTIGNTTSNNITMLDDNELIGIFFTSNVSNDNSNCRYNTVQNLNQTSGVGTDQELVGIEMGQSYDFNCTNNNIKNFNSTTSHVYGIQGIRFASSFTTSTAAVIRNNIINGLNNTATSGIPNVVGIKIDGYRIKIEKNKIMNLTGTRAATYIQGIDVSHASGISYFYNNVILISNGSNTNDCYIFGINTSGNCSHNIFHNTIRISGSESSSIYDDAAINIENSGGTVTLTNNILQNIRTLSNEEHYALRYSGSSTFTDSYNYLEATTSSKLVKYSGTEYNLSGYNTASSSSNNRTGAITINTLGGVPGATISDVLNTGLNLIATVSDDYDGNSRTTTPWIGAFEVAIPLPVELIVFYGLKSDNLNTLFWKTASETNNNYFIVEKYTDEDTFEEIGIIYSKGDSKFITEYSLIDYNVQKILNYYRLKQTDINGNIIYSEIISIDNSNYYSDKIINSITNLLGQTVDEYYKGIVIINYTDGTSIKMLR
jgi:hypothetical protein